MYYLIGAKDFLIELEVKNMLNFEKCTKQTHKQKKKDKHITMAVERGERYRVNTEIGIFYQCSIIPPWVYIKTQEHGYQIY